MVLYNPRPLRQASRKDNKMSEERKEDTQLNKDEAELAELIKARADKEKGEAPDPELKEAEEIMADPEASKEDKNWAKRYSDTKSAWYKERNNKDEELKRLRAALEEQKAKSPESMPTNEADLIEWQKQYPEVAGAIKAIATDIAKGMQGDLEAQVSSLAEKDQKSTAALTKEKVVQAHPDFDTLNGDKSFHEWVEIQDSWVGDVLYKGLNPKSIIQAINLYKMENNLLETGEDNKQSNRKTAKQDEAAAASLVTKAKVETPPTPKGKLLESEVLNWTDEEWAENKPLYDKARRTGNLVLNVTNAA